MNKFIVIYICSLVLVAGSFAQTPTASPISPLPTVATTTASVTPTASVSASGLADRIHQKLDRKFRGKHGITIRGDHDEGDLDLGKSPNEIPGIVVPIVAITLLTVFGAPVVIVGLIMYFSFSRQRALHRTVRMMVEKGQPVPEALLNPPPAQRQRSDLRRGVVLTMIGIGLMAFFGAASEWEGGAWTLGLIPFLIGMGYLLVWKLDTKKDNPPPVP
jgi:hypothetical protein